MNGIIKTYDQALDFIYSRIDFSFTRQQRYSEEVFNLDRMRNFMHLLDDPQDNYKTIHVAGTKGKGSISAMIASVLKEEGYRTGLYSSPHMVNFTERIQVGGEKISKDDFIKVVNELYPFVQKTKGLTTFELTTAIAFRYFEEQNIDFGVIEVGLGGRLDATNIIHPEVSVIASISMDHMSILGNTLEAIAGEKAGIIKENIPVVVSPQKLPAAKVFNNIAENKKTVLVKAGEILQFKDRSEDLSRQTFTLTYPDMILNGGNIRAKDEIKLKLPLLGRHQMENAGTAFCTIKVLKEKGIKISDRAVQNGFINVYWPGRFEILNKEPYLIIDAAHNYDSSRRLIETIRELFHEKKVILLFGASEDKDIKGMLNNFSKITKLVILTKSTHPRAAQPSVMKAAAGKIDCKTISINRIGQALNYALKHAKKNDIILASGSIFIAAAIREIWFKKYAEKNNK